jgi:hypothetical protein
LIACSIAEPWKGLGEQQEEERCGGAGGEREEATEEKIAQRCRGLLLD